jgi:hypothetical protein
VTTPALVWVGGDSAALAAANPPTHTPHQGVCLSCVLDPTRTPSTTLLCMETTGWVTKRGAPSQHVPTSALGACRRVGTQACIAAQPPRHPTQRPHQGVCLAGVPDPTRTPSATLLCIYTAGRWRDRGAAYQHVTTPALSGCVGGDSGVQPSHQPSEPTHPHPTRLCACHVSLTPPARRPPLSYVWRLQGKGGTGTLPTNM